MSFIQFEHQTIFLDNLREGKRRDGYEVSTNLSFNIKQSDSGVRLLRVTILKLTVALTIL